MFPLNDLSLKTQSVQLNKITSNTESTIRKQHELVSDDAIINELSSELVSCLGNGKFTPVSEDGKLLNMLSEFKLLESNVSGGVIILYCLKIMGLMIDRIYHDRKKSGGGDFTHSA